jgi:DNA polymerase (family 10)
MLEASAVAKLLVELGLHTALAGNNYFRSRAYLRAADSLVALAEPLDRLIGENRLREVPGIGDTIADIVAKLHRTGTHPLLEKLRVETPKGVLDMLSIPGLRPDKVNIIHKQLGVTDLAGLEAAAREDRLKGVKGLGAALQRKILQGLAIREQAKNTRHIHRAAELIATATGTLDQADPDLVRVVPAGDLRRGCELVSDLAVVAEVTRLAGKPKIVRSGDLAVHVTDARRFGITLLLATGSQRHLAALEQRAKEKDMVLTSDGLRRGRKVVAAKTEGEIYQELGLPCDHVRTFDVERLQLCRGEGDELPALVFVAFDDLVALYLPAGIAIDRPQSDPRGGRFIFGLVGGRRTIPRDELAILMSDKRPGLLRRLALEEAFGPQRRTLFFPFIVELTRAVPRAAGHPHMVQADRLGRG